MNFIHKPLMTLSAITLSAVTLSMMATSFIANADVLELKSGKILNGDFAGGSQNTVRFTVNNNLEVFSVNDILAITFTGGSVPAPAAAAAPAEPQPVVAASGEIPAGTAFMIRTRDILDSGRVGKGNKFTAVLEADIIVNNTIYAQQGDTVYGEVVDVNKAGRIAGKAQIDIQLTGLRVQGEMIDIKSNVLKLTTEATAKRSVGSTARGAAIGGLANGSDGAKTGAAVGLGVAILSPGTQVHVPSGTLLDFTFMTTVKL